MKNWEEINKVRQEWVASNLYELAVLKNGAITGTYFTPENDQGIEGWLRPEQVEDRLAKIARL